MTCPEAIETYMFFMNRSLPDLESKVLLKGWDFMYKPLFLLFHPDAAYLRFHDNEENIDDWNEVCLNDGLRSWINWKCLPTEGREELLLPPAGLHVSILSCGPPSLTPNRRLLAPFTGEMPSDVCQSFCFCVDGTLLCKRDKNLSLPHHANS